ncbi:DUF444 family protein [Pseudoduganella sp. UC29_71]|uniref:DUF444 family protein n=1 Tax=Pseudoduganella sp. UC29_71 TaxID=3350174 RepID=UPI00366F4AE1
MNAQQQRWYELFARGERDWLRHNEQVRAAVRAYMPQLLESPDLMSGHPERQLRVPLHLLEHARFRLAEAPDGERGAGQGPGRPGDLLHPGRGRGGPGAGDPTDPANLANIPNPAGAAGSTGDGSAAGTSDGGAPGAGSGADGDARLSVQLEFAASDIMDWLWEELELPHLAPKSGPGGEAANARSGWSRQGGPSQLDRRRTVMQAVKRGAARMPQAQPAFVNDDLRFRQAHPRPQSASKAVVLFALDVSASMTLSERRLAKTFFHFTLHGLRHRYRDVAVRFLAHTTRAWEFPEREFFQIAGEGGTQASTLFQLARDILRNDYGGNRYNAYLFYASDGENYSEDRVAASQALAALAPLLNYLGYVETAVGPPRPGSAQPSELHRLVAARHHAGDAAAICVLRQPDDAWNAIRRFFGHHGAAA